MSGFIVNQSEQSNQTSLVNFSTAPLKLTVTGDLYSGKSLLCSGLAEHYGLKLYSVGKIQREHAKKLGMTIEEYNCNVFKHDRNKFIDAKVSKIGKLSHNIIFDARLAWHFIPDSIKVYLKVDIHTAVKRSMVSDIRSAESYTTTDEAYNGILTRQSNDRQRFIDLYGVDIRNEDNYNIVIDTTNLTPSEVYCKAVCEIDKIL